MRKLSLVKQTPRPKTESPRRDRNVGKMRLDAVLRPIHPDRDYIPGNSRGQHEYVPIYSFKLNSTSVQTPVTRALNRLND